jgi:hypothetical protein
MIGIILLIIAILLYIRGNKKWSLLLFVAFMCNGLCLLTDKVIGAKNLDLAFIYTVVIGIYSLIYERKEPKQDKMLINFINIFFIFLLCSVLFSYIHYGFSFLQILQGGRHHFLFLSYFFLIKTKREDLKWLLHKLFVITVITAILYIAQVLTGLPFLPYNMEIERDSSVGLLRYYNAPPLLSLFFFVSVLYPKCIKSPLIKIAPLVLIIAFICTLGRTQIGVTLAVVCLGLVMRGQTSKILRFALVLAICLLPMFDVLINRLDAGGDSKNDINELLSGQYKEQIHTNSSGATMSYRFAWVYERVEYLSNRPFGEKVFGLGMISDSQTDIVQKRYNFNLGLTNIETGYRTQLTTPDIAYGNLLIQFGYVGGIILVLIWLSVLVMSYRNRKQNEGLFCLFLLILTYFLLSFAGSVISTTANLVVPFLLLSLVYQPVNNKISVKEVKI